MGAGTKAEAGTWLSPVQVGRFQGCQVSPCSTRCHQAGGSSPGSQDGTLNILSLCHSLVQLPIQDGRHLLQEGP
jgi:hypothetical protein